MKNHHSIPIISIICVISFTIFASFCFMFFASPYLLFSDPSYHYRDTGKSNAVDYINDKYGFHPSVSYATVKRDSEWEVLPFVLATMHYNDSTFTVMVDGVDISSEGKDDYQKDRITDAFLSEIKSVVGEEPVKYKLEYGPDGIIRYLRNTQLVSTYFDGTNLKEVLAENSMTCVFEYAGDVSFEPLLENDIMDTIFETGSMVFVSYPTEAAMDQIDTHIYYFSRFEDYIYHNAMYIHEAVYISANETSHYTFDIIEYDGVYLLPVGEYSYLDIECVDTPDLSLWKISGGSYNAPANSYHISSDADMVYMYIPSQDDRHSIYLNYMKDRVVKYETYNEIIHSGAYDVIELCKQSYDYENEWLSLSF